MVKLKKCFIFKIVEFWKLKLKIKKFQIFDRFSYREIT